MSDSTDHSPRDSAGDPQPPAAATPDAFAPGAAKPDAFAPGATTSSAFTRTVYTQRDFLHYLTALNVTLTVFGLVAALAGHAVAVQAVLNSEVPTASLTWMWVGNGALVIGVPSLMVQFFLLAYRRPAPAARE